MKKILHILIFTLLLVAVFCVSASAASGTWTDEDGRTWGFNYFEDKVTAEDGTENTVRTATITSANLKTGEKRTSELNIPEKVMVGENEYTVTKIASQAFKCGSNNNKGDEYLSKKYFGHVTFPKTLEEIGSYAFEFSAIYGTVVIPDSVTKIGEGAFKSCVGLDTVVFPASVDTVPKNCFRDCSALVEFKTNGVIKNYSESAFYNCHSLIEFEISSETLTIGNSAFYRCYCLSGDFILPNLTTLGSSAFYECGFIKSVHLGKSSGFNSGAFYGCTGIQSFTIDPENANYCTQDDVVFNKAMTELYFFSLGKLVREYTVPDSVVTIKSNAFRGASVIQKITLGPNVTTVEKEAFRSTGLKTMYFPINVTTVDSAVLYDCKSLEWVVCEKNISKYYSDMVTGTDTLIGVFSTRDKDGLTSLTGNLPPKFSGFLGRDCATEYKTHFYGYLDTAPTCEEGGESVCCLCGSKVDVAPLGHVGQILRASEFSCTTNESITVACINCNLEQEIISKSFTGHTLGTPIVKSTEQYNYSVACCTTCGEVVYDIDEFTFTAYKGGDANGDGKVDAKDVALLGKIVAGIPSSANVFACDVNGDGKVNAIDLLILKQYVSELGVVISENKNACSNHVHISTITVVRESCTDGGLYVSYCTDCGSLTDEPNEVAPRGHIYVDSVTKASTCSVAGTAMRKCSVCDIPEYQIELEKLPHVSSWWMLSDDEKDYEYSRCPNCNTLEYREVNRSVLNEIVETIPKNYIKYCTAESAALLKPIVDNAEKALTQEQVDVLVEEIRRVLPTIQYKVSDVPVIYLETSAKLTKGMDYASANIIVAYYDDAGNLQTLTDAEGRMRVRGNYTAGYSDKLPFNIKFSRSVNLFGMGEGKKYHLLANAYDQTTIRNALAFEFARGIGLDYTCKYKIVEVYTNGVFRGCYMLTTPIDIGTDRVDIDEEKDIIIHLSQSNGNEDSAFPSPIFNLSYIRLEEPSEYSPYTRSQMMRVMYQLDFAILSGDTDEMAKFMDVDSMVKYFVFHEHMKDTDIIWDSTRFYIEDGKLHGGPVWDLDISQGNVSNSEGANLQSNAYVWFHDKNKDGKSEYNYEGSGVTDAELNALNEYRSAIGTWASIYWAKDHQKDNNSNDPAHYIRWWFYYLAIYSEEFMVEVATFIDENQDFIKSIYEDSIDPETEKPVRCMIDEFLLGESGEAISRNAADAHSKPIYSSTTLVDAYEYLRTWWKIRSEWVHDYYTKTYLTPNSQPTE